MVFIGQGQFSVKPGLIKCTKNNRGSVPPSKILFQAISNINCTPWPHTWVTGCAHMGNCKCGRNARYSNEIQFHNISSVISRNNER